MSPAAATKPSLFLVEEDKASVVDMTREANTRGCELCGTPIGIVEEPDPAGPVRYWVAFFEVTGPDDADPTRLCKSCWAWVGTLRGLL